MSCHDQSCHSHHEAQGCGCSCHSCTCCSDGHEERGCDPHRLLAIADAAWLEALKEKIKQNILASDHQIDEIAKIIGETNCDLWHQKLAKVKTEKKYESRLCELMDKINCSDSKCNDPNKCSDPKKK